MSVSVPEEQQRAKKYMKEQIAPACVDFAITLFFLSGGSDPEAFLNKINGVHDWRDETTGQPFTFTMADWADVVKAMGSPWEQMANNTPTSFFSAGIKKEAEAAFKAILKFYESDGSGLNWAAADEGDPAALVAMVGKHIHYVMDSEIVRGNQAGFDGGSGMMSAQSLATWVSYLVGSTSLGYIAPDGGTMAVAERGATFGGNVYMYTGNADDLGVRQRAIGGLGKNAWREWVPLQNAVPMPYRENSNRRTSTAATWEFMTDPTYTSGGGATHNHKTSFNNWGIECRTLAEVKAQMTTAARGSGHNQFPKFTQGHHFGTNIDDNTLWVRAWGRGTFLENQLAWNNDVVQRIARNFPSLVQDKLVAKLKHIAQSKADAVPVEELSPEAAAAADATTKKAEAKPDTFLQSASDLAPVDLQCFLFENIRNLISFRDLVHKNSPYKNFACLDNRDSAPGSLISLLQSGQDAGKAAMLKICPDLYGLLTPYLKFYRVDYTNDDKLTPYQELQIPFPNFIDPGDIAHITAGDWGRFHGVGIKSFSWSLDGVQPAEVENNISANLKLQFQTLQDLFSMNLNSDGNFQAGITGQAGYLDLIIGSGTSFRTASGGAIDAEPARGASACLDNEKYEGENFRIKAVAGWSKPSNFAAIAKSLNIDSGDIADLEAGLEQSQIALYLQIVRHNLTFNEDGSVEMSIDYQAGLSGILRAPTADLFVGSDRYKFEKEDIDQKIKDVREQIRLNGGTDTADEEPSALQEELKGYLEKKKELTSRDRLKKYKKFLSGLYDTGKVYIMPIGKERWKKGLLRDMSDPAAAARESVTRLRTDDGEAADSAIHPASETDTAALEALSAHQAAVASDSEEDGDETPETEEDAQKRQEYEKFILGADKRFSGERIDLAFIYFGDLVESILEDLNFLSDGSAFQFLMGNVEVLDPLLAYQIQDIHLNCEDGVATASIMDLDPYRSAHLLRTAHEGLLINTNIANIPISLTYFQEWFVNYVVRPQKDNYPFLKFVKDMCSGLIGKAFGSICFSKRLPAGIKFDTAIFECNTHYASNLNPEHPYVPVTIGHSGPGSPTALVDDIQSSRERAKGAVRPGGPRIIPTMILYSVESKPETGGPGSAGREYDHGQGIFHYALGARCGLAKKITFNRNDQAYLRESRLSRVGALGAEQLRELYQVKVDMVGNTIHRNGQYIYIEPVAIGTATDSATYTTSAQNLGRRLGLGGYYLITKVAANISDGGFDVTVEAIQEGLSFEGGGIGVTTHAGPGHAVYTGEGAPPDIP